jgi:ribokinase
VQWIADQPSGRALITVDATAENTIVVVPGANAHLRVDRVPGARIVLAQLEVPLDAVQGAFEHARSIGATTILDPAPAQPLPATLLGLVDVIVPNEHEVALLGGVDALLAAGVGTVITTLGPAGVRVDGRDGSWVLAGHITSPRDATAAGDSFCGHLAAALAAGTELTLAVRRANAAGALATTVAGAVPSIPTRTAVDALLSDAAAPPPSRRE